MKCRFHPDREAVLTCDKFEYGYCRECVEDCQACTDPELYCRHRTHCIIWENCRKTIRDRNRAAAAQSNPAS